MSPSQPRSSRSSKKSLPAIIGGVVLVAVAGYFGIDLSSNGDAEQEQTQAQRISSSVDTCAMDTLPDQAEDTAEDILAGGPYDHPEDDNQRFGNYEGNLPQEESDFYREYTVETPGLNHRGERRIVTGGGTETDPDVWYYTDDHYESFCEIPDAESNN